MTGKPLGSVLISQGLTAEEPALRGLAEQAGITFLEDPVALVQPETAKRLPEYLARRILAVPLRLCEAGLEVAMADPFNLLHVDDMGYACNCPILPALASKANIRAAIDAAYGGLDPIADLIQGIEPDQVEVLRKEPDSPREDQDGEVKAPVIKLVNLVLLEAIRRRASDIHIEPAEKLLRIRYRVDGILREGFSPPRSMHAALCSRIKVLADLNIAEHRIPQDGRALIRLRAGEEVDIRINFVPTIYGEKIGIRLLHHGGAPPDIRRLGMSEACLNHYLELIHRPSGLILAVGPTGHGKTTALYAALRELDNTVQNLITIEDPVEYRLTDANQIQVNSKTGLTFTEGLRAILRQDPNVILVGEIRDRETAAIAIEAAMTGHLVLSTLHSSDAAHTIARLRTLGVDPFLASCSMAGIVSTRLIRRLCPNCRVPEEPGEPMARQLGLHPKGTLFRAGGCEQCRHSGYHGRTGIFELVPVTQAVQTLIESQASLADMGNALAKIGVETLWMDGLHKVLSGVTSLDELMRVTRH